MDFKTDKFNLMFGDCLERMKEIPDNSIDLILTDPPYGTIRSIGTGSMSGSEWDVPIDTKEMMRECHRILRPKGTMCLFSQDPYTTEIITNGHGNLPFSYRYVWEKNHFANAMISSKAPVNVTEDICVYFKADADHSDNPLQKMFMDELERVGMKPKQIADALGKSGAIHHFTTGKVFRIPSRERLEEIKKLTSAFDWSYDYIVMLNESFKAWQSHRFPKIFNLPAGAKHKRNILKYDKDSGNFHPTQKPVALLTDLIETYTNTGDSVLDFTMGSGSTGVAAVSSGRKFTGIEMNPDYFGTACQRVLTSQSTTCHTGENLTESSK